MRVAAPLYTLGRQRRGAGLVAAASILNVASHRIHGGATLVSAGKASLALGPTQLMLHDEMAPVVGLLLRSRLLRAPRSTLSAPSSSQLTSCSEIPAGEASSSPITDEETAAPASVAEQAEAPSIMVHPAEGGVEVGSTGAGAAAAVFCGGRSGVPSVVSSQNDITSEARLDQIVAVLEEKRVERQRKMFEDMIVFEGGAVSDHPSLGTRLIMRDFVHFALYNNKWGYYPKLFRKYRQLMTTGYFDPIPFASLRNQHDYERYATKLHESTPGFVTPTQLFQPYYGWVLAEYLVTTHRAKFDPREPLIVYDIGAGTGALALSVLDYLAEHFPDLYAACEYHAVEQNPHLIQLEKRRCVVLAVELFSGMPHDCVLWDQEARYYALQDPIILRYLRYLNWMQEESFHNLKVLCLTEGRETLDAPNRRSIEPNMADSTIAIFTKMAYIMSPFHTAWLPTVQMVFLEMLAQYFPRHHLFAADWSSVRQALPGVNGPVLQVKLRVAKDMYLRKPVDALHANAGMVDMCFPTDFDHLSIVYARICGAQKEVESMRHPVFWQTHGGDKTALFTTRSGYNPLLEDFQQFHVFTSHHSPEL
ncbi:putative S-adenosyl-L-methionine-dependent methyltransferase family protein [Leishmania donovani]|uniref:Protein arginine methyltransferase NDUFAF7 n=1 Tax=Leishmania donovani TaxID=5661 RepID=A0A504XZV5_LEIDO|nr:putative S-adenosyl-L-methionine-dependent methyltransferase family protein [Leishmania donovani]